MSDLKIYKVACKIVKTCSFFLMFIILQYNIYQQNRILNLNMFSAHGCFDINRREDLKTWEWYLYITLQTVVYTSENSHSLILLVLGTHWSVATKDVHTAKRYSRCSVFLEHFQLLQTFYLLVNQSKKAYVAQRTCSSCLFLDNVCSCLITLHALFLRPSLYSSEKKVSWKLTVHRAIYTQMPDNFSWLICRARTGILL